MEIHHHPKHSKKSRSYKEYFFEFLVIFIAIAGSFFAENLREHFVDKHKENEYMKSMQNDLANDSAGIRQAIETNKNQIKGLDSLLVLINGNLTGNSLKEFYLLNLKHTTNYNSFLPNKSTLSLLMKTGGLGLIRERNLCDEIINYDISLNSVEKQSELLGTRFAKLLDQQAEIMDFKALFKPGGESVTNRIKEMKDVPPLLSTDKRTINTFIFDVVAFKGAIVGYNQRLESLLQSNKTLGELIKDK